MKNKKAVWLIVLLSFFTFQFCFAEGQAGLAEFLMIWYVLIALFYICIALILIHSIRKLVRALKKKSKRTQKANNKKQIEIGYRGEGITYRFPNKEIYIDSTWINGRRIFFEGKNVSLLHPAERRELFTALVEYFNSKEGEKPIINYNSDSLDADLWKQLCDEFHTSIKSVETSTIKEDKQRFYDSLKRDLEYGLTTINIDGYILKTVEDLEKYWAKRSEK